MAVKKIPVFDFELCVSCGICAQTCPVSSIVINLPADRKAPNLYPAVNAGCIGCGSCERACPMGAVSMVEKG